MAISTNSGNVLHTVCVDGSYEDISRILMNTNVCINAMNANGLSPLHLCVFRSDNMLKAMKLLCEKGADLNAKTLYEGDTVLHLLVRNVTLLKAETAVMELLHMGADPSITNKFSRSAVDEALMRNYRYLTDLLSKRIALEKSVEEHHKYRYEHYGELLIEAIRKGDGKGIRLLAQKANVNYRNKNGCAPIHYVVISWPNKKSEVLRQLIAENADVNIVDYEGDTALNLLIKQKTLRENGEMYELAELLVNAGADPYIKDVDGWDAFKLATENDYKDILDMIQAFLEKKTANQQELFRALSELEIQNIRTILNQPGIDVNAFNQDGYAPIHIATDREAVKECKEETIELLLNLKANINIQCQQTGNSALHLAVKKKDVNIANFLIQKGIDQSCKNKDGDTAFEVALREFGKSELKAVMASNDKKSKGSCTLS